MKLQLQSMIEEEREKMISYSFMNEVSLSNQKKLLLLR